MFFFVDRRKIIAEIPCFFKLREKWSFLFLYVGFWGRFFDKRIYLWENSESSSMKNIMYTYCMLLREKMSFVFQESQCLPRRSPGRFVRRNFVPTAFFQLSPIVFWIFFVLKVEFRRLFSARNVFFSFSLLYLLCY